MRLSLLTFASAAFALSVDWHVVDGRCLAPRDDTFHDYHLRARHVDPSSLSVDAFKQYSGYLDNNKTDRHLFYWFFESRNDPESDPVILWLNGGPGCSSMTGLLMELGPSRVDKDLKLVHNPSSWNNNASVLFLDQPVNTGFSYSNTSVNTTAAASKDMYALLTLFMHQFPQYSKLQLHIAGESYAGHFITILAEEILSHAHRSINLKSIMLSNGLTDPLLQYGSYYPMACGQGGYPSVLDAEGCKALNDSTSYCQKLIQMCYDKGDASSCSAASGYCDRWVVIPYTITGRSVYDVRKDCPDGGLCYPQAQYVADWLNQAQVQKALGANRKFQSCNSTINSDFTISGDWMLPIQRKVPGLLDKIPVFVFAGDADFICNWLGNEAWTKALQWKGKAAFNAATPTEVSIGKGRPYGKVSKSGGLAFMQVYQSGHLVPMDQPEAALDLVNRWMGGRVDQVDSSSGHAFVGTRASLLPKAGEGVHPIALCGQLLTATNSAAIRARPDMTHEI